MNKMIFLFLLVISTTGFATNVAADRLPEGKDYPVDKLYTGKTAQQVDLSDEFTNMFRTRFKYALSGDIVFAGEYAKASWGCGSSGCHIVSFISKRTGRALDRGFSVYYSMDDNHPIGEEILYMDKNSRLIITGGTDEETYESFRYYYLLEGNSLKLLSRLPDNNIPPVNN
ncbi:hypothetical protein [Morganella psychrotolerans]|uniref:hypothetical protein n=1 Tax=Morganella psychrotolerans TaxID=368603 RepID=UPI0039B0E3DA